jgi:hypothetical protein
MFGIESGKSMQDTSKNCLGKWRGYTVRVKSNITMYFKQSILHTYMSSISA